MIKHVALTALVGVVSGCAATIFLYLLHWATSWREDHTYVILALPLAGLLIGWLYHRFGREVAPGTNLVLDEIHDPKQTIPARMTPLILFSTLLTHLFGGSAGREGTAVQMGAALADQIARVLKGRRRALLIAGAGSGFGAAIGAPFAGAIFGVEMLYTRKWRLSGLLESTLASFVAFGVTRLARAPHTHYPRFDVPSLELNEFLFVALAGLAFGLTARAFMFATHRVERAQARLVPLAFLRPAVGGALVIAAYAWLQTFRYAGLGLEVIEQALTSPGTFRDPLLKLLLTALTIGSGFKGGEFIPLVFIGTTLGSALSLLLPMSFQLLAAVGFAAVFGAAANTPLACAVMAMEIFGWSIAPYALVGCFMAQLVSGAPGIYRTQR